MKACYAIRIERIFKLGKSLDETAGRNDLQRNVEGSMSIPCKELERNLQGPLNEGTK